VMAERVAVEAPVPSSNAETGGTGGSALETAHPNGRPRRFALLAALVVVGLVGLAAVQRFRAPPHLSPAPSALAASAPTPITALPLPEMKSPEALGAYREGLQAVRDARWGAAQTAFARAVELDPSSAAAQMRLAITRHDNAVRGAREAMQKAITLRASLGERDLALLEAFEPTILREPSDIEETKTRLAASSQRYPGDVEFVAFLAILQRRLDPSASIEHANRCLALDPQYADCWQSKAAALARLGRGEEALAALDGCLAVSPAASDCIADMIGVLGRLGQCSRMEEASRRMIAQEPGVTSYLWLAVSLYARDRPMDAVRAALRQSHASYPEAQSRELADLLFRARSAILMGRFDEAERAARENLRRVEESSSDQQHRQPTLLLVELLEEMGRVEEAGRVATAYLDRQDAWTRVPLTTVLYDRSMELRSVTRRAGTMSARDFSAMREAWLRGWASRTPHDMRWQLWIQGYAAPASSAEDGREALFVMRDYLPVRVEPDSESVDAAIGRVY